MYSPEQVRNNQFMAITEGLKKALKERAPIDMNGKAIPVEAYTDIKVQNAGDDAEIVLYNTPSIVIMHPEFNETKSLNSNYPVYKDYNYTGLTVKEFREPIHGKLNFEIHTLSSDPDNDLILTTFMTRCRRTIPEIYAKVFPDSEIYDAIVLYWREPTSYDSEDNSKVRVFPVDATVHVETLEYTPRCIIDPTSPVDVTTPPYFRNVGERYTLSDTVFDGSSLVYVIEGTKDAPISGIGYFEDGTTFSYTGKTYNSFTGVSGIVGYHFYNEKVIVRL